MKRIGYALGNVVLLAVLWRYLAYVFHIDGFRPPSAGIGDWSDPHFINFLLEHWLYAARTSSDPISPPMYYPASGTLGYSHSLILFAPLYIGARTLLDPFPAETLTLVVVFAAGIVCLSVFLRRYVGAGYGPAVALSALVATSPNIINTATEAWMQRASFYLIPPIACLGAYALRMTSGRARIALSAVFGCALVSLLTQEIYTGLLFFSVTGVLCLGGFAIARPEFVRHVWRTATRRTGPGHWRRPSRAWLVLALVGLCLSVGIALYPIERTTLWSWRLSVTDPMRPLRLGALAGGWFLVRQLTLPGVRRAWRAICRAQKTVLRSLAAAIMAGAPTDTVSTHERVRSWTRGALAGGLMGAVAFVWIYGPVALDHRGFSPEQIHEVLRAVNPSSWRHLADVRRELFPYDSARPFVILGVAIALAWWPLFRVPRWVRRSSLVVVLLSGFVWILPLRLDEFSLWAGITALIPGTSVIRDPSRVIYIYELVAAGVVGLLVAQVRTRRTLFTVLVVTASVAILLADWHTRSFRFNRTRDVYDHWVTRDIATDPSCRIFFINGASDAYTGRSEHTWVLYGMDAAFVSLRTGMPTVNGYSAWAPRGWNLADPQEPGYVTGVREWIARHRLSGVCAFDVEARTMTPFQ